MRVVDRQSDAVCQRFQQGQIVVRECLPPQRVYRLDHTQPNLIGDERSCEQRAGSEPGLFVDAGIEVALGGDVVDFHRAARLEDLARYSLADRHAHARKAFCNFGIAIGEVREI